MPLLTELGLCSLALFYKHGTPTELAFLSDTTGEGEEGQKMTSQR
jgi:hypothetical protein